MGCGQAGGSWLLVHELITAVLMSESVPVFIYDLPNAAENPVVQKSLGL
jgi:hypothetical protein